MIGTIYILLAVLFGAVSIFLQKVAVKGGDALHKNYVFQLVGAAFGIILVVLLSDLSNLPSEAAPWLILLFASFLWIFASLLRFLSMELADLSLITGIGGVRVLFVAILATLLLGEAITVERGVGMLVLFAGLTVATWDRNPFGHLKNRGVQYAILGALLVSFGAIIDKFNVPNFDPMFYNAMGFLVPALFFPFVFRIDFKKVRKIARGNDMLAIAGAATSGLLAYYFILNAYLVMDVHIAYPASRVMAVLALVLGILFLGEKKQLKRRLLGAATAVAGAAMLVS